MYIHILIKHFTNVQYITQTARCQDSIIVDKAMSIHILSIVLLPSSFKK